MLKNIPFRHRLIGAIFIVSLGIIIIPTIFDKPAVDTLAVKESLPTAPSHEKWQDLSEIDYSFTELVGDLQAEEASNPPMTDSTPEPSLAQADAVESKPAAEPLAPLVMQENTASETKTPDATGISPATPQITPDLATQSLAQNTAASPAPSVAPQKSAEQKAIPAPAQADDVVKAAETLIAKNTWAVQLGAFSKPENAQALQKRLQEKGYAAYIEPMTDKTLTRVLVGVEADQKKAAQLLTELDRELHLKGIIVKL